MYRKFKKIRIALFIFRTTDPGQTVATTSCNITLVVLKCCDHFTTLLHNVALCYKLFDKVNFGATFIHVLIIWQ